VHTPEIVAGGRFQDAVSLFSYASNDANHHKRAISYGMTVGQSDIESDAMKALAG